MEAFKFVNLRFLEAAAQGRFWIGTSELYQRMEGKRADPLDGTLKITNRLEFDGAQNRAAARALGIEIVGDCQDIRVSGNTRIPGAAAQFVLCLSMDRQNDHLWEQEPQALFRISDVAELARRLCSANPQQLAMAAWRPVEYGPTAFDVLGGVPPVSPFRKGLDFRPEREVRIVWMPAPGAYRAAGFLSRPYSIDGLIERIA